MKLLNRALATSVLMIGAAGALVAEDRCRVGIAMPSMASPHWIADGETMVLQFDKAGYETDLQYAEDDSANQRAQIENMISSGVDALVIAAIDAAALSDALADADAAGIEVVAYDRLIRDSEHVDHYVTFDGLQAGVQQATTLLEGLAQRYADASTWNIEIFGSSPEDGNASSIHAGAMSVLQPMIDSGRIAVPSGQTDMESIGTLGWDGSIAEARMDSLLSANYTEQRIHGVLSPHDDLSIGIISSLTGVGYGLGDTPMPIVTGRGAHIPSVKAILGDEQYSTIFVDTSELARVTVGMVDALLAGNEPELNDIVTFDNGKKSVPSYLLQPIPVTRENWEEILIDSGYYSRDQIE